MYQVAMNGVADNLQDKAIRAALPIYERQIRGLRPWLHEQGRAVGESAMRSLAEAAGPHAQRLGIPYTPPSPPGPWWADRLLDPVIDPFLEGLKETTVPVLEGAQKKVVGTTIVAAMGILALGYLVGRLTA